MSSLPSSMESDGGASGSWPHKHLPDPSQPFYYGSNGCVMWGLHDRARAHWLYRSGSYQLMRACLLPASNSFSTHTVAQSVFDC
jgi:hypothetical protein